MRCYLKGDLRDWYDWAWRLLPESTRNEIKPCIASIRCGTPATRLRRRRGGYIRPEPQEGTTPLAWTGCDWDTFMGEPRCFILLMPSLKQHPAGFIVATLLHELAHVQQYVRHGPEIDALADIETEIAAWAQAVAWTYSMPADTLDIDLLEDARNRSVFGLYEGLREAAGQRAVKPAVNVDPGSNYPQYVDRRADAENRGGRGPTEPRLDEADMGPAVRDGRRSAGVAGPHRAHRRGVPRDARVPERSRATTLAGRSVRLTSRWLKTGVWSVGLAGFAARG